MISKTTIPKQHYVTIQYRKDASTESGLLGFASPYTKDAPFLKRKATQDHWAYSGSVKVNIDPEDDSISCEGQAVHVYGDSASPKFDIGVLFTSKCYPIIIDNELVEGFEIAKSVRRYGWGGGGNVVWRIADPRGFELEISSDNFARVIDCATLVNGVIQGKCLWGRDGSKNVLLPEASDVYQAAVKRTQQINTNISLTDVQVGDMVELLSKTGKETLGQYLGKYYFLLATELEDDDGSSRYYRHGTGAYRFDKKQVDRYLFRHEGKYFVQSKPKVVAINERIAAPLDKNVVAQEATDSIKNGKTFSDLGDVILVTPTKVKARDVVMTLEPTEYTGETWRMFEYRTDQIVFKIGADYFVARNVDAPGSGWPREKVPYGQPCTFDLDDHTLTTKSTISREANGYWGSREYRLPILFNEFDLNTVEKFRITIKANGITGAVYTMGYN